MGGRVGYEYRYGFSMVDADQINSKYKLNIKPGVRVFLFEIRTKFILKTGPEKVVDEIIDSETFDALTYPQGDAFRDETYLYLMASYRLHEYWMTEDEINFILKEVVAFANQMAAKSEHASLNLIPVVVCLDVCTVQQQGESFSACMDRAIRARNLVPLYLWPQPTTVECKKSAMLMNFLCDDLHRFRVEDINQGLALMQVCRICDLPPSIGAQISLLPCNHAFHSHCIVPRLEDNNLCPSCNSPAYDHFIAAGPPFKHPGD